MLIAVVEQGFSGSQTWRQFQTACACVVLAIGVGCGLYAVETLLLNCRHRFVENPADTMTRAIGLAHFSIGWLFLFTSPRLRNRAALGRLTFWTLFGIAFCWLFAWGGADLKNPLLMMAFYSFFFIHEACDEAHLFRHSGELPADTPNAERILRSLVWSVSLTFLVLVASGQIVRGNLLGRTAMVHDMPFAWLLIGWVIVSVWASVSIRATIRLARCNHGSVREMVATYQPLLAVYGALLAVLLIGSLFGSIGYNLVIMIHGMTWLVCTHRKLSEQDAQVAGLWSWLRKSPTGFLTLHLAVTVLALVLFALRTHWWDRTGFVCDLVSKTWFPYWSIMHIAMAFWRTK